MPVILAAQEAEIRRNGVQSQSLKIVHETLSQKQTITKKGCLECEALSSDPSVTKTKKTQNLKTDAKHA
jgi:hypothetical protein